jgi:hypothetical protein
MVALPVRLYYHERNSGVAGKEVETMKTVDEIFAAIEQLDAAQFLLLWRRLERLAKKRRAATRRHATAELKREKVPARPFDRKVMRRRPLT